MVESGAIRGRDARQQLDAFLRDTGETLPVAVAELAELERVAKQPPAWTAPLLGECVLGIDPSLTGFAICYSVPGKQLIEGEWSSDPDSTVRGRLARYERLIAGVLDVVRAQKPGLILIEGYTFAPSRAKAGHAHERCELGGLLRYKLCQLTQCPILEPAPASLKKFTTGYGKANKNQMIAAMAEVFHRRYRSDNAADARALCQLGLSLTEQAPPIAWPTPDGIPASNTKRERVYLASLRKLYGLPAAA